ncbi:hypothetical protein ACV1C5_19765, partial [Aeromonas caviae]
DTLYPPPVFTFKWFRSGDNYSDTGGQLKTQNIKQVEGIWCLVVDAGEADQQLKTVNAYRTVPLHSALIGHQFLDYVESRRSQGKVFLFDDHGKHH